MERNSPAIILAYYYPFGLAFNSYQRENSTKNNYLYNGKELQDELDLGWMDWGTLVQVSQNTNQKQYPKEPGGTSDDEVPAAYLNYLLFDKDFNFITGGFEQVTGAGDFNQELVSFSQPIVVTEAGYMFVYLSNESNTTNWVYFDDLKITHTKSPVIQSDDYYPFGLAFNSYSRENATPNQYKFGGKEEQDELALNTIDFGWRQYDPTIGRWNVVDQWAEKYHTTLLTRLLRIILLLYKRLMEGILKEKMKKGPLGLKGGRRNELLNWRERLIVSKQKVEIAET